MACRPLREKGDAPRRGPSATADRPVRAGDHLSARLGDRPLRLPLRLLHGGRHDLPAEEGRPVARGARPALLGLRRKRRAQAQAHRRRAAGAQEHHVPRPLALPASRHRCTRRADADHQRLAARPLRRRARRLRRRAHQRFGRYARSGQVQGDHALGRARQGDRRHRRGAGRRPPRQDQRGGAEGRQRARVRRSDPLDAWRGHGPDADRDHAARRDRRRPHRAVPAAQPGSDAARGAMDARRDPLPDRRTGALCAGGRDRRPARLHHAADA